MNTVSITCIDALYYTPTVNALKNTINVLKDKVNLTKVYWCSDKPYPEDCELEVVWVQVEPFTHYVTDYNRITLEILPKIIDTDFNIIIHADGFAVNADAWTDEFFEYDYIGAKWHSPRPRGPYDRDQVGNGGFCMRSRKFLNQISKHVTQSASKYCMFPNNWNLYHDGAHPDSIIPEDTLLCRVYNSVFENVKYAPPELADRWSIEDNYSSPWLGKSLGFHGKGNERYYGVTIG